MSDIVVTCPASRWRDWLTEGNLAGESWNGDTYVFSVRGHAPDIRPGERVYIVALGKLRGYAPLIRIERGDYNGTFDLIRGGDAAAVTIPEPTIGFRGWRKRWWEREIEIPFPDWRETVTKQREMVR